MTHAEKRAISSASSGFLARQFGVGTYQEIDDKIAAMWRDEFTPPAALISWARRVTPFTI